METAGPVPDIRTDLADLAGVVTRPGPVATVYLTTDPEVENASVLSEQRWRALREELAGQGAPAEVIERVGELVPDAHHAGRCLCVVAGADGVRLRESHAEPPARDVARWAELPSLVPIIEWRQMEPAHLLVLVDRQGADLIAYRPRRPDLVGEVKGTTYPVHDAAAGGWAQRHHQQNVRGNWEQNAGQVAAEVVQVAKATDAEVIVVAGDVRARQLFIDALPTDLAVRCVPVDGGRGPDGSEDVVAEQAVRAAATAAARVTRDVLAKFREEIGQRDRAVDGAAATISALARAQAALLLVHDDLNDGPADGRTAWYGPEPGHVATSRGDLEAMGVRDARQGRLADVLVRAALGTGADVRVVPEHGGPSEGAGAILRWS